jgi:hypothetical protein
MPYLASFDLLAANFFRLNVSEFLFAASFQV